MYEIIEEDAPIGWLGERTRVLYAVEVRRVQNKERVHRWAMLRASSREACEVYRDVTLGARREG